MNTRISSGVRRMLGFDLHWWEHAMLVSLALAALAAVFVVWSTASVIILQRAQLKDSATDFAKYKAGVAAEVSTANAAGETAKADAAKANAKALEIENANLKLKTDLEKERKERLKLEEKLAPRSISPEKITALSNKLKPFAGNSVDVLQMGESPEITNFCGQLNAAILAAGWKTWVSTAVGSGTFPGVAVACVVGASDADNVAAGNLLSALHGEGIAAENGGLLRREDWPGFTMAPAGHNQAGIRLIVGSKP